MRTIYALILAAFLVAGCASTPQSSTQSVYAAQQSLIVADSAIVEAHDAGKLTGEPYEKAKASAKAARKILVEARAASMAKDADKTVTMLTALNALLAEIALYTGSKP